MALHVARMGIACRIWWEKPEGKSSLGRRQLRWEDNFKMGLEAKWGAMNCTDVAQDGDKRQALVNTLMTLNVP